MSQIIAKKIYDRAPDGTPVSYRTKYYHYFDGDKSRPVMGSKADAVRIGEDEIGTVLRQLNALAGGGFFAMSPDETPVRDKRPPKAAAEVRA